jgi:hypothetical protein
MTLLHLQPPARRWLAVLGALTLGLTACHKKHHPGANWVLVVNTAGSISLLDTDTGLTRGPYLQDQLGKDSDELLDAAVTPDGKIAILTAFGKSRLFFVDLTDIEAPAVLGALDLPMHVEDVTLTANGKYAVITDGGFSPKVVTVDVQSRTIVEVAEAPAVFTNASAVGRDGTLVTVNYFAPASRDPYGKLSEVAGGFLTAWVLDDAGHLAHANDYALYLQPSGEVAPDAMAHLFRPVNVAVAPDGVTVLVPDVTPYDISSSEPNISVTAHYAIAVYRITAPGVLALQGVVKGVPRAVQSIAFSADGDEAYLLGNGALSYDQDGTPTVESDRLLVLKITGPGLVSYDESRSADLGHTAGSQWFGVDNLVVLGGAAFATYSSSFSSDEANPLRVITRVDLETFEATRIPTGLAVDGGIAGLAVVRRHHETAAPAVGGTCAGVCGTADRDHACFCDAACQEFGDCCADYETFCTSCDASTCAEGQICVNQITESGTTYACGCGTGFEDDGSGTCVDVDECTAGTGTCKTGATCENTDGGYACTCPAGFKPDGSGGCVCSTGFRDDGAGGCVAIDACADGSARCGSPASCTATGPGSYTCDCAEPLVSDGFYGCACPYGYESDGAGGCVDVDECASGLAACNGDATCRNVDGRYYCDCADPLRPDGHGGCTQPPPG